MAKPETKSKMIKMSVNLSSEAVDALQELARKRGTTVTEALRQVIGTAKYLDEVLTADGKVLVEDRRGRVRELVFTW